MTHALDPTFYRTPGEAASAPAERLAYVVAFDREGELPDALTVLDVDPDSDDYGRVVGWVDSPVLGDEFHHFGWNACSSALMHEGHDMHDLARRFLLVPGIRSSNIYVFDTAADPKQPTLYKTIEAAELAEKAGYSRPHTLHCGPDGVFMTCLGAGKGDDGPGGIALLDHSTFDVIGPWERDRGPQYLAYDAWWHLKQNTLVSSEWGTPAMIEDGIVPELLLGNKYGHSIHFWDLEAGTHTQEVDLGSHHQMPLELRPSHDPEATWGFVGVVISTEDLSASVFRWYRDGDQWRADKVISIPAEPADPELLPPPSSRSARFRRSSPTSTCRSTTASSTSRAGAPVSSGSTTSPTRPSRVTSARCTSAGSFAAHAHPAAPDEPLAGGPQMVEVSRDGSRVYFTNSLYGAWDEQFYPDGVGSWMAKLDIDPDGGMRVDERFFPHGDDFRGRRAHQVRLQGGDASSDSYCFR